MIDASPLEQPPSAESVAAGHSSKCLVCTSPQRGHIDSLLKNSLMSLTEISEIAAGLDISLAVTPRQLSDHRRRHGLDTENPIEKAKDENHDNEQLSGPECTTDNEGQSRYGSTQPVDSVGALDHIINFGIEQLEMQQVKPSLSDVTRAIQAKEDLLFKQQGHDDDIDFFLSAARKHETEAGRNGDATAGFPRRVPQPSEA